MSSETRAVGDIISARQLAPRIKEVKIYAPHVTRAAKPGQFVIVMVDKKGERIPLTLVDWSSEEGWVKLVFLEVGVSTVKLGMKKAGDRIYYILGPLGNPSDIKLYGTVAVVGGGVGVPAIYPIARALKAAGNKVISIIGARTAELLVYEEEVRSISDEVYVTTDDGSKGMKGFTSDALRLLLEKGVHLDAVWTVGPAPMMKACSEVTKPYGVKTFASLNSLMVCGIGMCGACRVHVGGEIKFTCIDGPEFDAHQVGWNELIARLAMYRSEEKMALERLQKSLGVR
ncbi:MAG: sulfide/dihydroorotate dehydrogenase-like FAD/NAD-binding protein [Thermoprotei archaeon]|nr:MAG: sulfide/dihydroorotate dehydrogenase-like FAD/NAD-binding protein [Thermoprotei archaeon]